MKKLLLALLLLPAVASAKHLLHNVPADVAIELEKMCLQRWPNSPFSEGWCIDREATAWLQKRENDVGPATGQEPDLLVKPPDIIIRPGDDDDPK